MLNCNVPGAMLLMAALLQPSAGCSETNTTSPLNPETYFGINGIGFFHRPTEKQEIRKRIELLHELGLKWDRSDFWWSEIEPQPGQWDYGTADEAMRVYRGAGVQMLPILCYGAAWRNTRGPGTPPQLEEWKRYVSNVTDRYRSFADTWEVWNEPNIIPFWRPQPDPDAYARLLLATREAAPRSNLVGMVLADLDHEFLERVLLVAGTRSFDRVSYHYYRIGQPEERTPDEVAELKLMLQRYGKSCPIWVTEMGVTSHLSTQGVSEEMQAIYWMRQILLLVGAGVERVFPFCLVDNVTDPGGPWGSQLGMVTLDGRKKPAFFAYKTLVSELQEFKLVGPVSLGKDVYAYLYEKRNYAPGPEQLKLVAWTTGDVKDIRINVDNIPATETAPGTMTALREIPAHLRQYTTLLGERKAVEFDGATQRVMLCSAPVYIPVENRHLLQDARTRLEPEAMIISAGQESALPGLLTEAGDGATSSVEVPNFCELRGDSFVVNDAPPEGWHSITFRVLTTSGTIEKQARLWVQPRTEVHVRPFASRTAAELVTSFTVTARNTEPVKYRFTSEPPLPSLELPAGEIGGLPPDAWSGSVDGTGPYFEQSAVRIGKEQVLQNQHLGNVTLFLEEEWPGGRSRKPVFRFAILPLLPGQPNVDGDLAEYEAVPPVNLRDPSQVLTAEWRDRNFSPEDASARVRCGWSTAGLYIAADVTDNHPMMNPQTAGPDIYKGDGLEIYLGTCGYQGEHYSNRGGGYFHFALSPGRAGEGAVVSDFRGEVQGAQIAVQPTLRGYAMEAFIPSSAMDGYKPQGGDVVAWDVQLNDRDDYAEPARQKALMWNGDHLNWLRAGKWGMALVK